MTIYVTDASVQQLGLGKQDSRVWAAMRCGNDEV